MCRKANFGDAMQSTALYMGDLPNWTYQVKGYLASKHLKLCDMNIAKFDNPYRISRFKNDQRESSLPLCNRCCGCTEKRQASCNENVEGVHGSLC